MISINKAVDDPEDYDIAASMVDKLTQAERKELITKMEMEMRAAAKELDFEKAANLRDIVLELKAK